MKPLIAHKAFLLGLLLGPVLGLIHLLTGGDVSLPLLGGAGLARTALVYALWPGFAAGNWTHDHYHGGHAPAVYFTVGFLALALAYGLLGLALTCLLNRNRSIHP